MSGSKTKVLVALDPVILRSALRAALANDARLEVLELHADDGFGQAAAEADVALVGQITDSSAIPVVFIDELSRTVEVSRPAIRRVFPYRGLPWLADLLIACIDLTDAHRHPELPGFGRGMPNNSDVSWPPGRGNGGERHDHR
jgi:hypothetical protein